jgi:deoxyribose-phosphate aldolase
MTPYERLKMNFLNMIDHTLLKNTANFGDMIKHCEEAKEMGAFSVCVNPAWVELCAAVLNDSEVKVCTVVGFPLGANTKEVKALETKQAIENGADEIDMVINIGFVKSLMLKHIFEEIKAVKEAAGDVPVKVIVECSEVDEDFKVALFDIVASCGVEFIKTSTGTTASGATVEDVKLMVEVGAGRYKVKASGGVSDLASVKAMVAAGADRIGTSGGLRIKAELAGADVSDQEVSNY